MHCITITPAMKDAPELVHLRDLASGVRTVLAGRGPAVEWLIAKGCCPGAAHMLLDALPWQIYTINGPSDAYQPL